MTADELKAQEERVERFTLWRYLDPDGDEEFHSSWELGRAPSRSTPDEDDTEEITVIPESLITEAIEEFERRADAAYDSKERKAKRAAAGDAWQDAAHYLRSQLQEIERDD